MKLLDDDEPPPYRVENQTGKAVLFFTADHAGRRIPRVLGDLGVSEAEMERHIAWDIGIGGVTTRLARLLDATAVLQIYSRLVIDCNRRPEVPSAFPTISEATAVPGNLGLDAAARRSRQCEIFDPYHDEIERLLAARRDRTTIYVAMHSFTPTYLQAARNMQVALLYHRRPEFSRHLAALLRAEGDLAVAENEPYSLGDDTDYGVPVHAEARGLDYTEIEIRQDLIADEAGQVAWAERLARLLPLAVERLAGGARCVALD